MSHSAQYSWSCPQCGRLVPKRFETCRCGGERDLASSGVAATPVDAPKSSPLLSWAVLGIVAIAAGGTLVALQVIPVKSAATQPAASQGAADKPNAPSFAPLTPVAPAASAFVPDGATPFDAAQGAPSANRGEADKPSAPIAPDAPSSLEDVVSRSIPAIVSIEAGQGRGSGFFAGPRTVITNRHVIQNYISVTVRLSGGQALPGRVETSSTEHDLAIVRVDGAPPAQPVLPLGTVNDVRPGQEVIAIGLALGVFQNSVTRGIISAVRRADRTVMLQTDAAINPGNSGGPLLNRHGQVVGINTMKITGSAESLGFAVAVDHARTLLAGGREPAPAVAAAQPSQPLAPAFSARSDTDIAREQGTRRYQQVVEAAARQAAQLDSYWLRIKSNCSLRVAPGHDREWFGLWDGRAKLDSADASCGSAIREMEELAGEIRTVMSSAQEDARRAAVLPGELREIRRRHRMDWTGFER